MLKKAILITVIAILHIIAVVISLNSFNCFIIVYAAVLSLYVRKTIVGIMYKDTQKDRKLEKGADEIVRSSAIITLIFGLIMTIVFVKADSYWIYVMTGSFAAMLAGIVRLYRYLKINGIKY